MTTVQTHVRKIADLEGFEITVTKNGRPVNVTANGVLNAYTFQRQMKGSKTVSDWRSERFERTYPGYSCKVLNDDGSEAIGQTLLSTVRETYQE